MFFFTPSRRGSVRKLGMVTTLVAGLVLGLSGLTRAAGDTPAAAPDWSTPKTAAKTFAVAMEKGDIDTVRASVIANEKQSKLLDALLNSLKGMKSLREAVTTKFGKDALKQFHLETSEDQISQELENADVKEEGDTATLTAKDKTGPENKPLTMKKVDGKWKVDLNFMSEQIPEKDMDKQLSMINASANVMQGVAADIQSGKLATAQAAQDELSSKMMAAFIGGASTEPATEPAPQK